MRALILLTLIVGCRGWTSEKPPVHLNPNMDTQEKLKAFRASDFWADGRGMRAPVEGTVARGMLHEDDAYWQGMVNNAAVTTFPAGVTVDDATMLRGQERFQIYCAPCHDRAGDGQGTVAARLAIKPPSLHDARIKNMPIGQIYRAMVTGVNPPNMPSYAAQVPAEDRWAIALYIRALQKSRDPSFNPSIPAGSDAQGVAPPAPAPNTPAPTPAPAPAHP